MLDSDLQSIIDGYLNPIRYQLVCVILTFLSFVFVILLSSVSE
jgi:hypothetical protein